MAGFKDSNFMYSPAGDLASGFNVGGGSKPVAPSVHPDINVSGENYSDAAVGNKPAENFGMMADSGPTIGVQLASVPETTSADLGQLMTDGMNVAPK